MPSTNKTDRGLSQFLGSDIPDWLQDYNADMRRINAAFDAVDRWEIARRERDPNLPDYGLGGAAVLRTAPYSGAAEIALQVQDDLYDAENMSARPQAAPNGTIIIKVEEE